MKTSSVSNMTLVAGREIRMRLRSRAFLVSTLILLLGVLAAIVVGGVASQNGDRYAVATTQDLAPLLANAATVDTTVVGDVSDAEDLVRQGDVDAALVSTGDALGVGLVALDEAPTGLVQALSVAPSVQLLEGGGVDPGLVYLVAVAFGIVYFMSAVTFGQTIAQSVVEEKSTRVVEILMASISPRTLMFGKVAGNSLLAFGQIVCIAVVAAVGLRVTGQDDLLGQLGGSIGWFVLFFAVGFVLIAALYAAAAALVSRQEDVGSVTAPVMLLLIIPYFLIIFYNDDETVLRIMSYVPFSAPIGMAVRIFTGSALWWEPFLSLAVIIVSTVVVVSLGARVYGNSLLRTGSRVRLGEALSGKSA